MKILVSSPITNQNSTYLIKKLIKKKIIYKFISSIGFTFNQKFLKFLPNILLNQFKKRDRSEIKGFFLPVFTIQELKLKLIDKLNIFSRNDFKNTLNLFNRIDNFTANYILNKKISHVYCYQNCALETFKQAKKNKIKTIYELPTVYWKLSNKIIKQELKKKRNIDLKKYLLKKSHSNKLDKEISYSDVIVVPSKYVKKNLRKYYKEKKIIKVVPYGFPIVIKNKNWYNGKRKLKIIFIGKFSQSKGLDVVLNSLENFQTSKIQTTFIGYGSMLKHIKTKLPNSKILQNVSNDEVLKELKENDVMILPTLFEGFGLSISEAMSQGLVVLTTRNNFLYDISPKIKIASIIKNEKDIKLNLNLFLKKPSIVKKIGTNAINFAKKNSWIKYQSKIFNTIKNIK